MIGKSWRTPQRVLARRIAELRIGDRASFRGVTVKRIGTTLYVIQCDRATKAMRGMETVYHYVWNLTKHRSAGR